VSDACGGRRFNDWSLLVDPLMLSLAWKVTFDAGDFSALVGRNFLRRGDQRPAERVLPAACLRRRGAGLGSAARLRRC